MIDIRDRMLYTDQVRAAYLGYATAQKERVLREFPNHKPKMLRHCLRIAEQGAELISTGEFNVRVDDPERFFALDTMDFMRAGMILESALYNLETTDSVLRDTPDIEYVDRFLKEVRRNNIG
jgi:hypothetical protein